MPPSQPAWQPLAGWASRAEDVAHPPARLIQQRLWVHDRVWQAAAPAVGVVIRVEPDETVDPVVTHGVQWLWPGKASWGPRFGHPVPGNQAWHLPSSPKVTMTQDVLARIVL
jgi:hypothetical protein